MKKILSLTDFSRLSASAVKSAFELAKKYESDLFIYHHLEEGEMVSFELDSDPEINLIDDQKMAKINLLNYWKELALKFDVKTEYLIGSNNMINQVEEIVEKHKIDMIVMSTVSEFLRSDSKWFSNAQSIIKKVPCSVLVLKTDLKELDFKNIVYASSFDKKDEEIFKFFLQFIHPSMDTRIHLLSIDTTGQFSNPTMLVKEAMKDFEKIALPHKAESSFYPAFTVDTGIRKYLNEVQADLLVMGSKINKPVKHFFQGNHTLHHVARANCPVLSINFRDGDLTTNLELDSLLSEK